MNPEVNAIVSAIPTEYREQIAALFDENHLLGEGSIMSKWDHGFSEGRVSGFRFQRDGYDCHVQIIVNAEVIRRDRAGESQGNNPRTIIQELVDACKMVKDYEAIHLNGGIGYCIAIKRAALDAVCAAISRAEL